MEKLNLKPENGKWTYESAQAYFIQQMAESMESILRESQREERTYDLLKKEREEHEIDKTALSLMIHKNEIINAFDGKESMQLSEFRNLMIYRRERYLEYISWDNMRAAIAKTDYLDYVPVGTGFRVKIIRPV